MREKYQQEFLERADKAWSEDDNVVGKWEAVRAALTSAAEDVLGTITRHQPDRFQESLGQLRPLLDHRNEAYAGWLGSGRQVDLTWFREASPGQRRS